jgi:hypothetical protein
MCVLIVVIFVVQLVDCVNKYMYSTVIVIVIVTSTCSEVTCVAFQISKYVKVDIFVFWLVWHLVRRYRSFHPSQSPHLVTVPS